MMTNSVTQEYYQKQHHAIFETQTIPLAQSQREDAFPPTLSAKHTPTHSTLTPIGVLFDDLHVLSTFSFFPTQSVSDGKFSHSKLIGENSS